MDVTEFELVPKNLILENRVITNELIQSAKKIIRDFYLNKYSCHEGEAPQIIPDLNMNDVAIKTTLRRLDRELDHGQIKRLNPEQQKQFLFDVHMLLTGKEKPRTKKNMIYILRTILKDPLLEREEITRTQQEKINNFSINPILIESIQQTLFSARIKDGDAQNVSENEATKIAKFIMVYMPSLIQSLNDQHKKTGAVFVYSATKRSNLETTISTISEYLEWGEGDFEDHVAFADVEEKRYFNAKRHNLFLHAPQKTDQGFSALKNEIANTNQKPRFWKRARNIAASIAITGFGLLSIFNSEARNDIQASLSSIFKLNTATFTPIDPVQEVKTELLEQKSNILMPTHSTQINPITIPQSDKPVLSTNAPSKPYISGFDNPLPNIENPRSPLSLANMAQIIPELYHSEGKTISPKIQTQLNKIKIGFERERIDIVSWGAYDTALAMLKDGEVALAHSLIQIIVDNDPNGANGHAQWIIENWDHTLAMHAPKPNKPTLS